MLVLARWFLARMVPAGCLGCESRAQRYALALGLPPVRAGLRADQAAGVLRGARLPAAARGSLELLPLDAGALADRRRAAGRTSGPADKILDIPMVQAISIWAAVMIVAVSLIADLAIVRLDPRIRAGGRAV